MPEPGATPVRQAPPPARSALFHAEQFVWLTARVLEQRLFAYDFLNGPADPVETALDAYRNDDGGYGHGLEPDLRGPVSQPLHTGRALQVLDVIGRCGGQRVDRVCRYLTAVSAPDGALPTVHPSLRGYPAAPSLPVVEPPPSSLVATGPVVGLLHRNEVWHAWLFRATDFCWQAVESLEKSHPYEVEAAVAFLDAAPDRPRAEAAADRLGRLVREQRLVDPDPGGADGSPLVEGATHFPHEYARRPDSLACAWFTDDEMDRSLDRLAQDQRGDGGWPTRRHPWAPGIALETRPMATIEALRTLRAYGRHIG
ncbi:hypothetical protein ACFY9X_15785 [Streptomyces nigra]|uniref:hypothetical protein n=1 Tax=Streptomyces nigra TaxID=1827580 RepID=UPI0036EF1E28